MQRVPTDPSVQLRPLEGGLDAIERRLPEPGREPGFPLAVVEWHDAWFDHDQLTIEDRREDYLVRTVGFLLEQGPRVVSVAQELLPDGEGFRAVTHIPVAVVERIVRIETR